MKLPDPKTFKAPLKLTEAGPPPPPSKIASFEAIHHIRLPSDFRFFLQQQDGGIPHPDCVTCGNLGLMVKKFFSFDELRSMHLPGVVEFARSPFGDDYAISCRPLDYGKIYFVDHETADPDSTSLRLTAALKIIPAGFALGFTRIAASFTRFLDSLHFSASDWVTHLLHTNPAGFRQFIQQVGIEYKDEIGTPVVCLVASYGTAAELKWIYDQGARSPEIVCHAVRNTRDPLNILRFLLEKGENAEFEYYPGKPYPMGYALKNNLPGIIAVLKEHGVTDSEKL